MANRNKEAQKASYQKWKAKHPTRQGLWTKQRRTKERAAVLAYYGNKCSKCNFDKDLRALQLDHINNDGWKERKVYRKERGYFSRGGVHLANLLLRGERNWEDFQLLCANCNFLKQADVIEQKAIEKYGKDALEQVGLLGNQ